MFNISNEQLSYVNGVEPGTGIIRAGRKIIPFDNIVPRDNELYKLYNTSSMTRSIMVNNDIRKRRLTKRESLIYDELSRKGQRIFIKMSPYKRKKHCGWE